MEKDVKIILNEIDSLSNKLSDEQNDKLLNPSANIKHWLEALIGDEKGYD